MPTPYASFLADTLPPPPAPLFISMLRRAAYDAAMMPR